MKTIEIRLYCANCGHILEIKEPEVLLGKDIVMLVAPCTHCQKDKTNETK